MPTDAEIEAAKEAIIHTIDVWDIDDLEGGQLHTSIARAALEAAERVRAAAGAGDDCEALERAADIIEQMAGKTERG